MPKDFEYLNDPFVSENDFYSNHILNSCFWEIELSKRHYDDRISNILKMLHGNQITASSFDFEQIETGQFSNFELN